MRTTRLIASAVAGAALAMSTVAVATAEAPRTEYCSSTKGGLYFSPWGKATVLWEPKIRELVQKYDGTWDAVKPVTRVIGADGADLGITMPIGMQHDSIGLDGRICYPGGFSITLKNGAHLRVDDGFAIRVMPCGAYARPVVNGVRATREIQLATCFAPDALASVAGIKDGGLGGGIRPWPFKVSQSLAEIINTVLGERALTPGEPLFGLAPILKFTPFRAP
ncbi:hypothetical protein Aple_082440 [Acrocarpospora pleiomorpha]|uniref:Htaa domain-containing protein n=1 Tax=Acrocarpospora pleiomorpha TaxID=90975 RepID=A0A5M3XVY8_9ACTN|nr:hypothetical protein [Acrocarpospora pleiomorpha]GES25345.1 hypothetical protein Aple_082440 [Acrocarpospora pleiomorpha]